jgi:hypothetical protein
MCSRNAFWKLEVHCLLHVSEHRVVPAAAARFANVARGYCTPCKRYCHTGRRDTVVWAVVRVPGTVVVCLLAQCANTVLSYPFLDHMVQHLQ